MTTSLLASRARPGGFFLCMLLAASAWAQAPATPSLGAATSYGLLSGGHLRAENPAAAPRGGDNDDSSLTSATPLPVRVLGRAGAGKQVDAGIAATQGVFAQGAGTVPQALDDLAQAQAYCTGLGGQPLSGALNGQTLEAGTYAVAGDATLTGTLTLSGDSATVVVLNVAGALHLGGQVLLRGVQPGHVFWNVGGAVQLTAGAAPAGVVLAQGAVTAAGPLSGCCALLSKTDVTLTYLSPLVGHNQFFAAASPLGVCVANSPGPNCDFVPTGSELILDGSFEHYNCLPQSFDGLYYPSLACFWDSGTNGTADYYHTGAGPTVGVPFNEAGSSQAIYAMAQNSTTQAGEAYAGFIAHRDKVPYYEYVAQPSPGTLRAGHNYYGEFAVRRAPMAAYSVKKLGMTVVAGTSLPIPVNSAYLYDVLPLAPLISASPVSGLVAGPDQGWRRLGGIFPVSSTLQGFTVLIGNFDPSSGNLNGSTLNRGSQFDSLAYYYVDNVTLSMVTEAGPARSLNTVCGPAGSTTLGTAPMPAMVGATYAWTAAPADPSLTPNVPNPTVSPTQTTTYTLTVSIPHSGQPLTSSTSVVVEVAGYKQNLGATYAAPAGLAPYEIGTYGSTTTLNANGGTMVFDGRYHVRGHVRFTNGTYQLRPGTEFYVEPDGGTPNSGGYGSTLTQLDVQDATLSLVGATLRGNCGNEPWSGVRLAGNGVLRTSAEQALADEGSTQDVSGRRSLLRDMLLGISSAAGNHYYLRDTDFTHNGTSLQEYAQDKVALAGEGVRRCTFRDGDYGIVLWEDDYYGGHVFGGDYGAAQFTGSTFENLRQYGLYATAGNARFSGNTFRACGRAALAAWSVPQAGPPEAVGNTIEVPAISPPGSPTAPVGIEALDPTLRVRNNTIGGDGTGPAPAATAASPRVGIAFAYAISGGAADQLSGNTLTGLDVGVRLPTGRYGGTSLSVTGNTFRNNGAGLVLASAGPANYGFPVTARVRCNSFVNEPGSPVTDPIGIWLQPDAVVTSGMGDQSNPNGNAFQFQPNQGHCLINDGANQIDYQSYNSIFESSVLSQPNGIGGTNTTTLLRPVTLPAVGACQTSTAGVHMQRLANPGLADFTLLLDSLRQPKLTPATRARLLSAVLASATEPTQLASLEAYLPATTPDEARLLGLGLLGAYRQRHDVPGATRLRARLRTAAPAPDAELAASLTLTEALDQMGSFLPGLRPLQPSARVLLSRVATSGTHSAEPACRLLRAYEPTCPCRLAAPGSGTAARLTGFSASGRPALGAYPNPASTMLTVPLPAALPGPAEVRVYDATGRLVLHQPLTRPGGGEVLLAVAGWAPGLYQLVLTAQGRVLGTQRLAIQPHP